MKSDFRGRLPGWMPVHRLQQVLLIRAGLSIPRQDNLAAIGGGHMHIHHLHGGEFFQYGVPRAAFASLSSRD